MSWKGIVKVMYHIRLQTLVDLFSKSKVLKGLVLCSVFVNSKEQDILKKTWT